MKELMSYLEETILPLLVTDKSNDYSEEASKLLALIDEVKFQETLT